MSPLPWGASGCSGDPISGPPEIWGELPPSEPCFSGKRPRAELAAPRIGCSVTTRKPGPGRSEAAADGVSQPACLHPLWGHTPTPLTLPQTNFSPSKLGFIVLQRGARRPLQNEPFAASPWTGVYFALIYFPPFVGRCSWLGRSPRGLFLKHRSWKREVSPCSVHERNYK